MGKTYAIFAACYLPSMGGVENYTRNLAWALADGGDHVVVATSNSHGLPPRERPRDGVEIIRFPCFNLLDGRCPVSRKNADYRRLFSDLETMPLDYVVVNTRFYRHSLEGLALARAKGVRPIIIDHGSAHLTLGNVAVDKVVASYEHAVTACVKRYDADYYAVSRASCQWLGHFGIEAKGVLNNSIDAQAFRSSSSGRDFRGELHIDEDAFVVSFVGRLTPEKGIESILAAAEGLSDHRDVLFLMAGDGPLRPQVEKCNLSNVRFLGRLDGPDVAALLLQSDTFCLPSRSEGFSTSLLECAACEVVPIVTKVGGVEELMPGGDGGCILKSADPHDIVRAIELLHADQGLRYRLAKSLRERVETDFSWEKTAEKVRVACEAANAR